jgi:hypothetical protein
MRVRRDPMRVYELLRLLGHDLTEDALADLVVGLADATGVRADSIIEDRPCSAPVGSEEWRLNRAWIVSVIVSCIVRVGRLALLLPDAEATPRGPDGDTA